MKKIRFTLYMLSILVVASTGCKRESVFVNRRLPETTIAAGDTRLTSKDIHLSSDTAYVLATNLSRDSGQSLSIDAGTLIKVMDKLAIIINPGATIVAKGTAGHPIIFTSTALMGSAGMAVIGASFGSDHYWQGIRIYGYPSGTASSGTLTYARIEFAGGSVGGSTQPAVLLQNVNKTTVLENIQVSYSYSNNAFEFAGGDCNARDLISYASGNTDFFIHQGYKGMLQNLLAYRHPFFPASVFSFSSIYISETGTQPLISNLTVMRPDTRGMSAAYTQPASAALIITSGAGFHIRNSVIMGFPKQGWYLDNTAVGDSIVGGRSDLMYSIVHCNDSTRAFYLKPGTFGGTTSADFKNFMLQPQFSNQLFLTADQFAFTDPANYNVHPDPLPKTGSPLFSGANFDSLFSDAFFIKVNYRGALGTDNWLKTWTNFLPLQTNYNN